MIYLRLFYEFFKTGLFAVGGGLATLPFLYDIGDKTGWYNAGDLADMVAISESTPGPIGVNMATYVGFTSAGIPGAVIATLGLIAPSIIIIIIVAKILAKFKENKYVQYLFYGLRAASVGMIAAAGVLVLQMAVFCSGSIDFTTSILSQINWIAILLGVILFFAMRKVSWHPVVFIAASAVVGVVLQLGGY
ncbi:MAG: chromate transporter [Lachnospiraceae bacterium]|nr:chromate transporter [Lachnospiraceae bacterium]